MRILEVRDGFIKLESNEKLTLSSFLEVVDRDKKYVAQVIQSRRFDEKFLSFSKILFLYDGTFNVYDGTRPSREASVQEFPIDLILKSFESVKSIKFGTFFNSGLDVSISEESFNRRTLISIDNQESLNKLLMNFANEFSQKKKTLIIDMLGLVDASAKFKAGVDFKLPLNSETLEFMYEDCLNDATLDSKNLVKEIFADLSEYSKSVEFLPFGVLKSIVDDMVEKSHIFKLLVLKNKLAKFDNAGYFATSAEEVGNIDKLLSVQSAIVDLSKLDGIFQNRYLSTLYSALIKSGYDGQVFVLASNAINKKNIKAIISSPEVASTFITHSRFKYLAEFKSLFTNYLIEPNFTNNEIFKTYAQFLNNLDKDSLLLVGENTKFIPLVIKLAESSDTSLFDEIIEIDELNNDSMDEMHSIDELKDEHIVAIEKKSEDLVERLAGDVDLSEPPMVEIFSDVDEPPTIETSALESEMSEAVSDDLTLDSEVLQESFKDETEFHTEVNEFQAVEIAEEIDVMLEEVERIEGEDVEVVSEYVEQEQEINDVAVEEIVLDSDIDEVLIQEAVLEEEDFQKTQEIQETVLNSDEENVSEPVLEVLPVDDDMEQFDEIIELDSDELEDGDIIVDMSSPEEEALNREIIEDVDKVFTSIKEETLTDSDLDFIDELNQDSSIEDVESEPLLEDSFENVEMLGEFEELSDYSEVEADEILVPIEEANEISDDNFEKDILETKSANTPIVPVYDADIPQEDLVVSDPIEQGDTVSHAKYGTGIVEKMIKYGSKTLFSINFDNVGRRLLDPSLTEIKKV